MVRCTRSLRRLAAVAVVVATAFVPIEARAQQTLAPGGFLESASTNDRRTRLIGSDVPEMPAGRGPFTFPGPYSTRAARITTAEDCDGGADCVYSVGYSYWRITNFHENRNEILILLSLRGYGPTLFSYNKGDEQVTKLGVIDPSLQTATGEAFYFSGSKWNWLYVSIDGTRDLRRYDVDLHEFSTVFDVEAGFGVGYRKRQVHSSADDRVHSATLQNSNYEPLGCMVFFENTGEYRQWPQMGYGYDECQIDKSGRWLVIKEKLSPDPEGRRDVDNRIIDLNTGAEYRLLDQDGAGGHSDMGWGWMVAKDNKYPDPNVANAIRVWTFGDGGVGDGRVVYHDAQWVVIDDGNPATEDNRETARHISTSHIVRDVGFDQQFACGSSANFLRPDEVNIVPPPQSAARSDEIICFKLNGSKQTLVVAPVLTDLNATGGGFVSPWNPQYGKWPKGNLDYSGGYFIWTTNLGGARQDAYIVRVPGHKLTGSGGGGGGGGGGNDTLASGEFLQINQERRSPNGQYQLIQQGDGNLVLYGPSGYIWASNTVNTNPGAAEMQGDGNLVVHAADGTPLCASGTNGYNGAYLKVLDSGQIEIYTAGGTPIWTNGQCYPVQSEQYVGVAVPGRIDIEQYDASFDRSAGNAGGGCRSGDVDLQPTWDPPDSEDSCHLGMTEQGEWVGFSIDVAQTDTYVFSARVAHPGEGGTFHVEVDGHDVTGPMRVPDTGGWSRFTTIRRHGVFLSAGHHALKLVLDSESQTTGEIGEFNYLALTISEPFNRTPHAVPGRIEVEDFDRRPGGGSSAVFAYHDRTSGNLVGETGDDIGSYRTDEGVDVDVNAEDEGTHSVVWTQRGEWLGYTVDIADAGSYALSLRLSHPGIGGKLHFEVDGHDVTGPIIVPDTGGWEFFATTSGVSVTLPAGRHVIYLVMDEGSPTTGAIANINYFTLAPE